MTPAQVDALYTGIPMMLAKRRRRSLWGNPNLILSVDAIYDLVLAETGDADVASEVASAHAAALERGKMETGG
jgi:hypothetical protein